MTETKHTTAADVPKWKTVDLLLCWSECNVRNIGMIYHLLTLQTEPPRLC